ncbi:MAG: hypothetical protein KF817_02270 [Phycisphaeraceae bacterium]|nr:hypothetical protein [Phycisphaeraceae bacterium]
MKLEIERRYLLSALPRLPGVPMALEIEQGYLGGPGGGEGRLRRTTRPGHRAACHFTVKRGDGLVREEHEVEIDPDEFTRRWPETVGRRLRKRRHIVPVDRHPSQVWEIDEFLDRPLVLLEIELDRTTDQPDMPPWLRAVLVREVTDDPRYRNVSLATETPRIPDPDARTGFIDADGAPAPPPR